MYQGSSIGHPYRSYEGRVPEMMWDIIGRFLVCVRDTLEMSSQSIPTSHGDVLTLSLCHLGRSQHVSAANRLALHLNAET